MMTGPRPPRPHRRSSHQWPNTPVTNRTLTATANQLSQRDHPNIPIPLPLDFWVRPPCARQSALPLPSPGAAILRSIRGILCRHGAFPVHSGPLGGDREEVDIPQRVYYDEGVDIQYPV